MFHDKSLHSKFQFITLKFMTRYKNVISSDRQKKHQENPFKRLKNQESVPVKIFLGVVTLKESPSHTFQRNEVKFGMQTLIRKHICIYEIKTYKSDISYFALVSNRAQSLQYIVHTKSKLNI